MWLEGLSPHSSPSADLKENVLPYMLESGIDVDIIHSDPKLVSQGLMVYQVIDKRRRELDDIAKGL